MRNSFSLYGFEIKSSAPSSRALIFLSQARLCGQEHEHRIPQFRVILDLLAKDKTIVSRKVVIADDKRGVLVLRHVKAVDASSAVITSYNSFFLRITKLF